MCRSRALCLALSFLLLLLASTASANHSITELVSTGPDGGGPADAEACYSFILECSEAVKTSADGTSAFFVTADRLVGADTDTRADVYKRSGAVTTLMSSGPSGGTGSFDAGLLAASSDGTRVIFQTSERLTGDDEDTALDIYERAAGTTRLLSGGPAGGNGPYGADFGGASEDATHVTFRTTEQLVSADTDPYQDIYESSGGTTTLVSTGPLDNGNVYAVYPTDRGRTISGDGQHIFFRTGSNLTPDDPGGGGADIYDRTGGTTRLVSTGPADLGSPTRNGASYSNGDFDVSYNGDAIFVTFDRLVPEDLDSNLADVYLHSGNTTTLASTGPLETNTWPLCNGGSGCVSRISRDGAHIFFYTHESLTSDDTGGYLDLYERDRTSGTVRLVSIGPNGGNGPVNVGKTPPLVADDGSHVFFSTTESLVSADTDSSLDIYERFNGTTSLVSTGPTDTGANTFLAMNAVSADGSRLFWTALPAGQFTPDDTNNDYDVYERYAGATTLITAGSANYSSLSIGNTDPQFLGSSPDGTRVFFGTIDVLTGQDNDICGNRGCNDLYERRLASVGPQSPGSRTASVLPTYNRLTAAGDALL